MTGIGGGTEEHGMDTQRGQASGRLLRRTAIAALALLMLGAPAPALAAGALDQEQTEIGSAYGHIGTWDVDGVSPTLHAQTFVPGVSGQLDQVSLPLRVVGNPDVPLTIEIRTTTGGEPTSTTIGGASVPQSSVMSCACLATDFETFRWDDITLTSPAPVVAGTLYAIVLSAPGAAGNIFGIGDTVDGPTRTNYEWAGTGGIPYLAGTHWSRVTLSWFDNQSDAAFKTYVTSPAYTADIQAPINPNGSSVFKAKGIVPVRFSLSLGGVATCALPPATIALSRLGGADPVPVNEDTFSGAADSGGSFRIVACQYAYNVNARALGAGTYLVEVKIDGQTVGSATFELH